MKSYVLITDDPERVRHLHGNPDDWSQRQFHSAADALAWERERRRDGAVTLASQGWQWGCAFSTDSVAEAWVASRNLDRVFRTQPKPILA